MTRQRRLHSMTSVLLNGGILVPSPLMINPEVALDDVSVTEWRCNVVPLFIEETGQLHSMTSVLLNGGQGSLPLSEASSKLHSMTSVLLNGGSAPASSSTYYSDVALDDVSVTEWRDKRLPPLLLRRRVALDDVSVTEWRLIIPRILG